MSGLGRCGGLVNGVRCGIPLGERDVVCGRCQHLVTELYWRTGEGRRFISSLAVKGAVAARKEQQEAVAAAEEEARRRQDQAEATRAAPHLVYYARLGHNHIKIGTTYDLTRRMAELRVVNESNLLAAEPGGFDVEQQRHEQFRKWRYQRRKEDFGEGPDLLDHIREVRAAHGSPYELAARLVERSAPQ